MSADVELICSPSPDYIPEIQQTVSMVADVERSMRPSDNPSPRPVSIEDIDSDPSKSYYVEDTRYPKCTTLTWVGDSARSSSGLSGNCNLPRETENHRNVSLEIRLK